MTESRAVKPRRPRAKRGEGDKLRMEILDAADRLLLEAGSEAAVSIQAIADAVGCTPPAIYLHFADKDALMFEVCARHFDTFLLALATAETDSDDPLALLLSRGRAYIQYGLDHPEPYRILFMQKPGASSSNAMATSPAQTFALLSGAVEECIESGIFPESDPFTVACALWAAIHGLTSLMISNPEFPWPSLDELLQFGAWSTVGLAPEIGRAKTRTAPPAKPRSKKKAAASPAAGGTKASSRATAGRGGHGTD